MAAPPTLPPLATTAVEDEEIVLGSLRQVRAAAQFLDTAAAGLATSLALPVAAERRASVVNQAPQVLARLGDGANSGGAALDDVRAGLVRSPYLRDWIGDEVDRISLAWAEAIRTVAAIDAMLNGVAAAKADLDLLAASVRVLRDALRTVIVATASITIPSRLNQFLDETSVGRSLSFESLFVDELPNAADRAEVLRRIAEVPAAIHGVVDVTSGSIIAISSRKSRRRQSYLWEAGALLAGGVLAYFALAFIRGYLVLDGKGLHAAGDGAASLASLVTLLVVFAAGAAFHFVVDLVKAQQGSIGAPQWMAVADWLLWLHARELKVISSILTLWIVFVGILVFYPGGGLPDPQTAFFGGFAFDSLADVIIKRFDSLSSSQLKTLSSSLAGT